MELRASFIEAMSRAATGVTIVTTDGPAGRFGQTVSAMCSVSADPPSLLVCIKTTSVIVNAIRGHRALGVNVLRADQRRVADTFAGRKTWGAPYDFGTARWDTLETGAPSCRRGGPVRLPPRHRARGRLPFRPVRRCRRGRFGSGHAVALCSPQLWRASGNPAPVDESPLDLDVRLTWEDLDKGMREKAEARKCRGVRVHARRLQSRPFEKRKTDNRKPQTLDPRLETPE